MAKRKQTILSLDTLNIILIVLGHKYDCVNNDALATAIYNDFLRSKVTKEQLHLVRNEVTRALDNDSVYRAGNVLRVVEAIELAARTYRKHDLNK